METGFSDDPEAKGGRMGPDLKPRAPPSLGRRQTAGCCPREGPEGSWPPQALFFQAQHRLETPVRPGTAAWRLLNASDVVHGRSLQPKCCH